MKRLPNYFKKYLPGIRVKIIAIVLGITLILTLITMVYAHTALRARLEEQLNEKSVSMAQNLAARSVEPALTNNIFDLYDLAYSTKEGNQDVFYVLMVDNEENILVHTFQDYFPPDLFQVEHTLSGSESVDVQKFTTEKGILRDVAAPVFEGPDPEIMVRLGVIDYSVQSAISDTTWQILLISLLTFLVTGTGVYFISTVTFIKPINSLLNSVKAVSEGDLSQQVKVNTGDELSELADAFNSMTQRLSQTKKTRDSLLGKIINSQEEERQRVARELHDETGPTLSTLMISLKFMEDSKDTAELKEKIEDFRQLLMQSLEQVRLLAWKLTPTLLVDLGLKAALESFIDRYWRNQEGWEINLQIHGLDERRLPSEIEVSIYRVVQEALTNIYKHAQASKVWIFINATTDMAEVVIEDNGIGIDLENFNRESKIGMGLTSMQERIELVGGTFFLESSPNQGTAIKIEIPLSEKGGDENFIQNS